ncbi:MAG: hypothetical protein DMG13_28195, partial [Acidobacteria bacterium]
LKALIRSYWFCRDMPKNFEYLCQLHRRLLTTSADPEERERVTWRDPRDLEVMPFPIDGRATGLEQMLADEEKIGGLGDNVPSVKEVCAQDLVEEAFKELRAREELQPEYQRVKAVAERWGY